jgi:hypothetical protein
MRVHAVCVMGNHYHIVQSDPDGNAVNVQRDCNHFIAKGLNATTASPRASGPRSTPISCWGRRYGGWIGDNGARSQRIRIGRALGAARDRRLGDLCLRVGWDKKSKQQSYSLVRETSEPAAAAPTAP